MINEDESYTAPDHAFISAVSGMVHNLPWDRFERFFEARPLVRASAIDQVFMLRILAIQELLCVDDDSVLAWLKSQMYLSAFLSPEFKPKVPKKALLNDFRNELMVANLLEPFRLRCQNVILKKYGKTEVADESSSYLDVFAPTVNDFPELIVEQESSVSIEDQWVICPMCNNSNLSKIESKKAGAPPQASCNKCGHNFKV